METQVLNGEHTSEAINGCSAVATMLEDLLKNHPTIIRAGMRGEVVGMQVSLLQMIDRIEMMKERLS